jgi:AAT family amino acid transporter
MIAIGGSIGTGLFLGTGRAPAPQSLAGRRCSIPCDALFRGDGYCRVSVAGSFSTYSARFVDEPFGFSLSWNYAFNDAISTAGDLTAAQLLMEYWIVCVCIYVLGALV